MLGLLSEKIEPFVKRQCAPPLPTGERVGGRGLGLLDIEPPHPALRADLSPVGRGESYCVAAHSDALAD